MALPARLAHFCLDQVPSFSAYLPYLAYEETEKLYLVSKDADPTHLAWGVIFECLPHPAPGEKQAQNLKGLFELGFPPGTTIQISTAGLQTETIPRLLQYRQLRQPGIHADFAHRRVQRLAALLLSHNTAIQTAPLRDLVLLVSVSVPILPVERSWHERLRHAGRAALGQLGRTQSAMIRQAAPRANRFATDVEQLLLQASLCPRRIAPARLATLLFPILNPNHPYQSFEGMEPDRELRRQMVMADTQVLPHIDGVEWDGYHYRSMSPLQLPPDFSLDRMQNLAGDLFNSTQQIPTSFLLTLNAVTYDRADTQRGLNRRHAIITQQAVGPMSRIIPRLGLKALHYSLAMAALEHGHIPLSAYLHLAVWAPTPALANQAIAAADALWRAHNFTPQHDGPASLNLIRESLPLALSANATYLQRDLCRARTILSSNCASLAPVAGDWKGTGRPILLMVSRRGQPAALDLFHNPAGGNYNAVICGLSGSGKSVLGNDLILGLVGSGATVWCIDKGRSYERMITTLGGDHLVFHPDSPINLNPFSFIDTPAEFQERITGLKALVAQMASPSRPISDLEDALMGEAIQEAYGTHGHATSITHIASRLAAHPDPRCHDLATMLYPYTAKGEFARFFEGEATVDVMTSPLLLLELEDLSSKPKLQSVIFLALILAVRAAMERGDRGVQRCLLIDEAWQFIAGSGSGGSGSTQAAQFVTQLYRVARKFNLAAITISQSLADFLDTEAGQAILANSDTRIVYQHKNETLRDPRLAYSPWEATLIRSLTKVSGRYAECFIQHPTGAGIYRHVIDPVAYQLFTTNPEEVAKLHALMKHQHRSLAEAVRELAGTDTHAKPVPANIAQALA